MPTKVLIEFIGKEVDDAFIDASVKNGSFNTNGKENLKIVFTSLHGTSIISVPDALSKAGYTMYILLKNKESQMAIFQLLLRQILKNQQL